MKRIGIPLLSLAFCLFVLWKWTGGFTSFTVFSYTLNAAGSLPRVCPDMALIDQDSSVFNLDGKRKYLLINFVYLNCPYVCHKVNNQLEQIYHLMDSSLVPSKLEFITVSFDTDNDNVSKIKKYRSYFGSAISGWTFALPHQTSAPSFTHWLRKLGVWKYQVPSSGIINHSIYLFLVSPDKQIVHVFDPARENNQKIVQQIEACFGESTM